MLKKAGLTVRHWQTKRSGVKNKQNVANRLTKVRDQLNQDDLDTPEITELEAINAKLKEAWKELRKVCNVAREERDAFLHERALDEAIKNDTEVSKEMEKIRQTEEQKSAFQKLRTMIKN